MSATISEPVQALCEAATRKSSLDWEFLFVEDGSTDDTFAILADLNRTDPRVKVVRLSRNYGSHTGAAAGLQFASGHAAVIMAGDLQDHPREIPLPHEVARGLSCGVGRAQQPSRPPA